MSTRLTTALLILTATLAAGEFVSSVIIWRENYPDSEPMFAVAFGALFLAALWLIRSGRITGGAVLAGALFLFEVVSFPSWQKHGAADWTFDSVCAVLSLAGLLTAIAVLALRLSARRRIAH
jgi:hypothetical protein